MRSYWSSAERCEELLELTRSHGAGDALIEFIATEELLGGRDHILRATEELRGGRGTLL